MELKKSIAEFERIDQQIRKKKFTEKHLNKFIKPYVRVIRRNQKAIYRRLLRLTKLHIDRIEDIDPDEMTDKEKINMVKDYYQQATDKDNPLRVMQDVEDNMHGRLVSPVQSYDPLDNKKYS